MWDVVWGTKEKREANQKKERTKSKETEKIEKISENQIIAE
jgi:hypothetical protein